MRTVIAGLVLVSSLLAAAPEASAVGEVFKIETAGVQYCGDLIRSSFNARNNVDLYVRVVSPAEVDLDVTPLFQSSVPLVGNSYLSSARKVAFTGSQTLVGGGYVSVIGTLNLDKVGTVKGGSGTFIQSDLLVPGCFSSGKWIATQRIF